MPWEDVVTASQATGGKGVWVNLPISASMGLLPDGTPNATTYASQWAQLLFAGNNYTGNKGLPENAPVYVEHSNEVGRKSELGSTRALSLAIPSHPYVTCSLAQVWNFGFSQYIWNKLAAIDECNRTTHPAGCLWNNDGSTDTEAWSRRRHAGKVYELSRTFEAGACKRRRNRARVRHASLYPSLCTPLSFRMLLPCPPTPHTHTPGLKRSLWKRVRAVAGAAHLRRVVDPAPRL